MSFRNVSIAYAVVFSTVCLLGLSSSASASEKVLEGGISYLKIDQAEADHPNWLEGSAYSAKNLTMRVFRSFASGRIKSKIPTYTNSTVRLRQRVLSYWKGYKPGESCRVTCVPLKDTGHFKFHHSDPEGPKGYLQCIGRDEEGYMKYRIWFSATSSS